ncbi:MAG: GDP-mannose 4,6-dehydratase [Nitrospirae bacterium]|nr:GDP-mannose 4,6-dehydratase [Nitrospirota bacterium]
MKKSNHRSRDDRPKVLITGATGFVGSHLADLLVAEGYQVFGMALTQDRPHLATIESRLSILCGDVRDFKAVAEVLADVKPDYVYHLAGSAFVPDADADPRLVYDVNFQGTLNMLEAVRAMGSAPRTLVVSSAEVYGRVPEEALPVNEDAPLRPLSPYGVTKACADLAAYQYAAAYRLPVIRVRPFNHIGPRQSEQFVCSSFAKQIAEIEKGVRKPVLHVGNLEARRDFTDVRDVVRAYRMILEKAEGGEVYNVGRGKAWRVEEIVKMLLAESRVQGIELEQQPVRVRPNDVPVMLCDPSKLEKSFGWKSQIPIEQTLRDLLGYWREKIKVGS